VNRSLNETGMGMGNDDPYADEERIPPPRKYPPPGLISEPQTGNVEGKWEKGVDMDMDMDMDVSQGKVGNESSRSIRRTR
jgi:hypothetical protein